MGWNLLLSDGKKFKTLSNVGEGREVLRFEKIGSQKIEEKAKEEMRNWFCYGERKG